MGSLQIFVVGSAGAQRCIRQQCKFNMTGGGKRKENEWNLSSGSKKVRRRKRR